MKKGIYILIFFGVLTAAGLWYPFSRNQNTGTVFSDLKKISIHDTTVIAEIANTHATRAKGLSQRPSLEENTGMFFIFPEPGIYMFWMKDMHFPIDIVWIDKSYMVIGFTENISPESYPKTFSPKTSILYALEVPASFVQKHNISIGETIYIAE